MTHLIGHLKAMRPTLLLVSGRGLGLAVAFGIPIVLARTFDPDEFGTYRLLFLIYGTLLALSQLGMAESLYYFVPRRPGAAGRWVANAVATLAAIGAVAALGVTLAAPLIAARFNNPLLVGALPKLGLFLGLMLISTALEIVMVCRKEHGRAAFFYAGSDVIRALLLTIPALVLRSVDALMTGAVVFAAVRCLIAAVYLRREYGSDLRVDRPLWGQQLRYALPFAAAVSVELAQLHLHQYAVALWFDAATFGIYSVGCLQIPLVDLIAVSAANVMMVSMTEQIGKGQSPLPLWHDAVQRLAFVFVPMAVLLLLVARELIVAAYTPAYLASVPIFMVSTAFILLATFPVDAVLRVYAATRSLLALSVLRLGIIVGTIGWFVNAFELPGAVLVTATAAALAKLLGVVRAGHLMGAPLRRLLPWRGLAGIAAAAVLAIGPAWLAKAFLGANPLLLAAGTAAVYGVSYLAIVSAGSLLVLGGHAAAEPSEAV